LPTKPRPMLELDTGFIMILRDVLYVPSLQRNLISVSCLDNDGYTCLFEIAGV
jgi:hypothetical protein